VSLDGCLRAGGGGFATVIWWCSLMVHRCDFDGKKTGSAQYSIVRSHDHGAMRCGPGKKG
jgi:hypothetical protein